MPIQTRHPLPNVWFEMYDLARPLGYAPGSIDLFHARDVHLAVSMLTTVLHRTLTVDTKVRDFSRLINEAACALRRGGLFISCEWFGYPVMQDNSSLSEHAPCTHRFFHVVNRHLMEHGIESIAAVMPDMLRRSGAFDDVQFRDWYVPIGSWDYELRRVGEKLKTNMVVFAISMQLWLVEKGYCTRTVAQALVNGFLHEVDTIQGMELRYRIAFARKA